QCHFFSVAQSAAVEQHGMQVCIQCHDGSQASNECKTCHVNPPTVVGTTMPSPQNARALVSQNAARNACYRCHDPGPCDSCHGGFRMPHPEGFGGPPHAEIVQQRGVTACNPCHQANSPVSPPCLDCHDPADF
ncbi:MAG: hypothetical protein FWE87_04200, partial [Coriobacteriia bacterium]|nr:hypothetical protein [Coriobacteriia bacterium]